MSFPSTDDFPLFCNAKYCLPKCYGTAAETARSKEINVRPEQNRVRLHPNIIQPSTFLSGGTSNGILHLMLLL
jgi:hypothetical protein